MVEFNEKYRIELTLENNDIIGLYDLNNRVELKNYHDRLLENSLGKIYVLYKDEKFEYVGSTIISLNSEIKRILNLDNEINTGKKLYNKICLSVFCAETTDIPELESIAAELIFLIKKTTGQWPDYQNKMHFNNNFPNALYAAQLLFQEIYSFKLISILEKDIGSWGLRGDPYLWEELVDRLKTKPTPKNIYLFYELITTEITELLGQTLEKGKDIHIKRYESQGSSSGYVSSDFWINDGIPRLLQLFAQKCMI